MFVVHTSVVLKPLNVVSLFIIGTHYVYWLNCEIYDYSCEKKEKEIQGIINNKRQMYTICLIRPHISVTCIVGSFIFVSRKNKHNKKLTEEFNASGKFEH